MDFWDFWDEDNIDAKREMEEILRELDSDEVWVYYQGEDYEDIRPEDYDLYDLRDGRRVQLPEGTNKIVGPGETVEEWEREGLLDELRAAMDGDCWSSDMATRRISGTGGHEGVDWYYDDSGYHSYVLLNGTLEDRQRVMGFLMAAGLQVRQVGPSRRPADNGQQYRWYIRVLDENGEHPKPERIEVVLASLSAATEPTARPETYIRKIEAYREEISRLRAALNAKESQLQAAVVREEHVRRMYEGLQDIHRRMLKDLEESRKRMASLEAELCRFREVGLEPEDAERLRQDYEYLLREKEAAEEKLAEKEKELSQWIESFDSEMKRWERENTSLQVENAELRERVERLSEGRTNLGGRLGEAPVTRESKRKGKLVKELFCQVIQKLLPNLCFLRGSLDELWYEVPNLPRAVEELAKLSRGELKGDLIDRAAGSTRWWETHLQNHWRIYFKKCQDGHYKVLVSHKGNQEEDIEWLKTMDC